MTDSVAGALSSKCLDISEGLVTRHVGYIFQTRKKITVLMRQFEILDELHRNVELEIELRSLEGDEGQALKTWNTRLEEVKLEAEQFLEREITSNYYCFCNEYYNPGVRCRVGRKAARITKDIDDCLKEKVNYGNVRSHPDVLEFPETRNEYNPPSRTEICDKIFNLLKNSDDQFVGCYGMGGIGKTTLAKEVWRLAREERQTMNEADASKRTPLGSGIKDAKVFDKVIMIQVSTSPVITKIQEQIAEVLGISLTVNGEMERANELYYALNKMETKVLIIFDDIWDVLDMRSIGVPCEKGVLNPKILLTSRTISALRETGSGVNNIQLDELLESEAKMLFESIVGKVENERLAEQILEKCGGHPLVISVVACIVKHRNLDVWKDTLTQLSLYDNPEFDDKKYSVIKLSIKNVGEELKDLMLLCGILRENKIPVLNLLMYCVGLRSFKSMNSLETAWVRLHKLICDLIDRSLLVGFDETRQFVKINDMASNLAARLAIETNKIFTPDSADKLDRLPTIPNDVTTISLPCAVDEFPDTLKFRDLEFFLYHPKMQDKEGEDVGSDAPRWSTSLFAECEKLRVLSLKGISTGLPSLVNLINLRTLCLHGCSLKDSGLSDVKELKNLEVLSLRESDLTCLPGEVEMLTRLKLLDLHRCKDLEVIPVGLLSKLSKLEHLYMRNTVKFRWNGEGSASLSELESMQLLACIEIDIESGVEMPGNMDYNKLQKFYINQGIEYHDAIEYDDADDWYACKILLQSLPQGSSAILLQRADFIRLEGDICQQKVLFGSQGFENLSKLHIVNCKGMQHLFSLSMANNLVKLRSLLIAHSDTIEEIVYIDEAGDRENANRTVNFPKLDYLGLVDLPRLRSFVNNSNASGDCQLQFFCREVSLPELRDLEIVQLPEIETVWSENMQADSLSKLYSITIFDCSSLVTLFNSLVSLPELRDLFLLELPKLKTVWGENMIPDSLSQLNTIHINYCRSLVTLFNSNVSLPELRYLTLKKLSKLETLFNSNVSLPKLEELIVNNLPKLETMCTKQLLDGSLSHLRTLEIEDCYSLRTPFTYMDFESHLESCRLKKLPNLDGIWVENLINLSRKTLTDSSIIGCGTLPHHILEIVGNSGTTEFYL